MTDKPNWTLGPWRVSTVGLMNDGSRAVIAEERVALVDSVAPFKRGEGWRHECAERDANAHLISSAPDMAPLVEVLASLPIGPVTADDVPLYGLDGVYITHGHVRAARAALAKARGQA